MHARETKKATAGYAGYDLFSVEDKTLFPRCVTPVTTKIEMEIPSGYFEKVYPSCNAGIINSYFQGTVLILMANDNSMESLVIKAGQRIAQIFFLKKEEVVFTNIACLSSTKRGSGGFGSTGI